jgi:hypothetical protein
VKIKVRIHTNKWEELRERNAKAKGAQVRVGVFGSETHEGTDLTLVELAAIHEFGSPAANIPERSFIRRTLDAKHDEIKKYLKEAAKSVVEGKTPLQRALNLLGTWAAREIKKTITQGPGIPPPLRPATIAHKKSSRPLVDTGQLKNAITYVVVGSEGETPEHGQPEGAHE